MAIQEFELLSTNGVPEFRFVMSDTWIPYPKTEMRNTHIKSYLRVSLPDDVSDAVWVSVRNCAIAAAASGAVAGVVTGGAAIIPAFMALFGPCMSSAGYAIASDALDIRNEVKHGDWYPA